MRTLSGAVQKRTSWWRRRYAGGLCRSILTVRDVGDKAQAFARTGTNQLLLFPVSPTAFRAALMRLVSADCETIRPFQTASSSSSLLTT